MDLKFDEFPTEIEKGSFQFCLQNIILHRNKDEEHELMQLKSIKIPTHFKPVSAKKKYQKLIYFLNSGEFIDEIVVDSNDLLVDGYSTFTILKGLNIDEWIVKKVS